MELTFRPKFYREFAKVSNKNVIQRLNAIFKQIEKASDIRQIGEVKKLEKYSFYYRIKIKISDRYDYRLVLMIRHNKVWAESIASANKIFYKQ